MPTSLAPRLTLIVARARNGVIGCDGALPWRIPEEMRHFRQTTTGHALIVGRRTYESIGRPLPGRRMIVISRGSGALPFGCERAGSLNQAIEIAATKRDDGIATDEAFVAGGAEIYALALPRADRLLITEVDLTPQGDAFFAAPDADAWQLVSSDARRSAEGIGFTIQDWRRRPFR
ncbi:MAG: dihydrofolate reductase [Burkholderiaceae bacterium]